MLRKRDEKADIPPQTNQDVQTSAESNAEQELVERVAASPERARDGLIHNVVVLKGRSANGRVYPPETLRSAVALFEGARVFANHNSGSRDVRDLVGMLRDVRFDAEAVRADLEVFEGLAPWLLEIAERAPDALGLSINASGRVSHRDGADVVEQITRVRSVDVVAEPAAVSGLFEARQQEAGRVRELEEEKQRLEGELERLRAEHQRLVEGKRLEEERGRVKALILKSGLPEEAATETFIETLAAAGEAERIRLIGDRMQFLKGLAARPHSTRKNVLSNGGGRSTSDYLAAITR